MENKKPTMAYVDTSFNGKPFLNSDSIVVEYDDILQVPELYYLCCLINSKADLSDVLYIGRLYDLEYLQDIMEWYINRPYKELMANFIATDEFQIELKKKYGELEELELMKRFSNDFMIEQLTINQELINVNAGLNFLGTLKEIMRTDMIKKYLIFSKYPENVCKIISECLTKLLNREICVKSIYEKSFSDLMREEEVPNNSTFVFADLEYVKEMKEIGLLKLSSILVADTYGYNVTDDGNLIIDINKLHEEVPFKLDFFNNFYQAEVK